MSATFGQLLSALIKKKRKNTVQTDENAGTNDKGLFNLIDSHMIIKVPENF